MIARLRPIALGLALAAAAPLAAQAPLATYTPERDRRCAAVVAIMAGQMPDDQRAGVAAGLSYFLGRWEAATGKRFEDALTPEYLLETAGSILTYNMECGARMQAFGVRMQTWGEALKKAGEAAK
ncbi:MAG: hypothetical protein C0510_08990 [Erythrobacter sp.]|nr:hypothetical protein [Erythrobacter sp.]